MLCILVKPWFNQCKFVWGPFLCTFPKRRIQQYIPLTDKMGIRFGQIQKLYKQNVGAAMGCKPIPRYADMFMADIDIGILEIIE